MLDSQVFAERGFRITRSYWSRPATPKPIFPLVHAVGGPTEVPPQAREFSGSLQISPVRPRGAPP